MSAGTLGSKYLARVATWEWHDAGTVDILDADGNVAQTLDEWQTFVFQGSDANQTLDELIADAKQRPPLDDDGNPLDPTDSIMRALQALTDLNVVDLRDTKSDLLPRQDLPVSKHHLIDDDQH